MSGAGRRRGRFRARGGKPRATAGIRSRCRRWRGPRTLSEPRQRSATWTAIIGEANAPNEPHRGGCPHSGSGKTGTPFLLSAPGSPRRRPRDVPKAAALPQRVRTRLRCIKRPLHSIPIARPEPSAGGIITPRRVASVPLHTASPAVLRICKLWTWSVLWVIVASGRCVISATSSMTRKIEWLPQSARTHILVVTFDHGSARPCLWTTRISLRPLPLLPRS